MSKKIPEKVLVKGKELVCPICANTLFTNRRALLNTEAKSFFGIDFLDPNAYCYICSNCTHVMWFMS